MLFFLLINVKMPTIVGILTFMGKKIFSCSAELSMKILCNLEACWGNGLKTSAAEGMVIFQFFPIFYESQHLLWLPVCNLVQRSPCIKVFWLVNNTAFICLNKTRVVVRAETPQMFGQINQDQTAPPFSCIFLKKNCKKKESNFLIVCLKYPVW